MATRLGRRGAYVATLLFLWSCADSSPANEPSAAEHERDAALARAAVFVHDARPELVRQDSAPLTELACRFAPTPISGTTPKFTCELEDGTSVKVKYGSTPEVPAELAASRLLRALGFGADRVRLAERVRCYGCPSSPFYVRQIAEWWHVDNLAGKRPDYGTHRDFMGAAVEWKLDGDSIDGDIEGWSFFELDRIDPARGGATRADVDALRLMAIFLAHWDNKSANQRLVCLSRSSNGACARSLIMLQDVGATFGPRKVDLGDWRRVRLWADDVGCRVSMASFPYDGGTFGKDVTISDRGRQVLARRLAALSRADVEALFMSARFPGRIDDWVAAFEEKVEQLVNRRCPS